MRFTRFALVFALLASMIDLSQAQVESNVVRHSHPSTATTRLIVTYRDAAPATTANAALIKTQVVTRAATRSGVVLTVERNIADAMVVVRLPRAMTGTELESLLAALRADPAVASAVPDARRYAQAVPNDPQYSGQWWLMTPGTTGQVASIDAEHAWDISTGSNRVVVAVLDTGVLFDHPDLGAFASGGKLLPGYDFITDPVIANDGDARDADASDPGDWVDASDMALPQFGACDVKKSSWHGSHVAGIIGGAANNSVGIASLGWSNWILPVRVLGKCSGSDSDILAGIAWAAGLTVTQTIGGQTQSLPVNLYPARIINMSLGSDDPCPGNSPYSALADQLRARGISIFAAAGNGGATVEAPGGCAGIIAVGAVRHLGTKVAYSAFGPAVAITAPGGNTGGPGSNCGSDCQILSDSNTGATIPVSSTYDRQSGTSFSTPMAAGVAGLMLAVNPQLNVERLLSRMQGTARPFPTAAVDTPGLISCASAQYVPDAQGVYPNAGQCVCTTTTCGAGLLDARAAVTDALRPIAAIAATAATTQASSPVLLDASASVAATGASLTSASFAWALVGTAGAAVITPSIGAQVSLGGLVANSNVLVRLTATDSLGRVDTQDCQVNVGANGTPSACGLSMPASIPPAVIAPVVAAAPTPAPASGGGGGGALPLAQLALLALLLVARRRAYR